MLRSFKVGDKIALRHTRWFAPSSIIPEVRIFITTVHYTHPSGEIEFSINGGLNGITYWCINPDNSAFDIEKID